MQGYSGQNLSIAETADHEGHDGKARCKHHQPVLINLCVQPYQLLGARRRRPWYVFPPAQYSCDPTSL